MKLLGSVDALEKELTQKLEQLKNKDDLVLMLQEKITKQQGEIQKLRNAGGSPKAKLAQQFQKLNIFSKNKGGGGVGGGGGGGAADAGGAPEEGPGEAK